MDFEALATVVREFGSVDLLAYAIENEIDAPGEKGQGKDGCSPR